MGTLLKKTGAAREIQESVFLIQHSRDLSVHMDRRADGHG